MSDTNEREAYVVRAAEFEAFLSGDDGDWRRGLQNACLWTREEAEREAVAWAQAGTPCDVVSLDEFRADIARLHAAVSDSEDGVNDDEGSIAECLAGLDAILSRPMDAMQQSIARTFVNTIRHRLHAAVEVDRVTTEDAQQMLTEANKILDHAQQIVTREERLGPQKPPTRAEYDAGMQQILDAAERTAPTEDDTRVLVDATVSYDDRTGKTRVEFHPPAPTEDATPRPVLYYGQDLSQMSDDEVAAILRRDHERAGAFFAELDRLRRQQPPSAEEGSVSHDKDINDLRRLIDGHYTQTHPTGDAATHIASLLDQCVDRIEQRLFGIAEVNDILSAVTILWYPPSERAEALEKAIATCLDLLRPRTPERPNG